MFAALVSKADAAVQGHLGGEAVIYRRSVSLPADTTLTGLFDRNYILADSDGHTGVQATAPALFVRSADLPADAAGDNSVIVIRGVTYKVIERKPDDLGGTLLILHRVP